MGAYVRACALVGSVWASGTSRIGAAQKALLPLPPLPPPSLSPSLSPPLALPSCLSLLSLSLCLSQNTQRTSPGTAAAHADTSNESIDNHSSIAQGRARVTDVALTEIEHPQKTTNLSYCSPPRPIVVQQLTRQRHQKKKKTRRPNHPTHTPNTTTTNNNGDAPRTRWWSSSSGGGSGFHGRARVPAARRRARLDAR